VTNRRVEVFPARREALERIATFIEDVGVSAGFGRADCLRLRLLLEELLTNTVVHGHGRDSDEPVSLTVEIDTGEVTIIYEDTAPPYDPFTPSRAVVDSADLEARPIGGLGLSLIAAMVRRFDYVYAEGRNRISLRVTPSP
jgi:serine/threonine-protein kinase RsbW